MKKLILILVVLLSININAQTKEAKLILRDGSELIGLVQVTSDEKIRFKKNKESESSIYDYKSVDKLLLRLNYRFIEYQYKIVDGSNKPGLYKVIFRSDPLSLFYKSSTPLSYETKTQKGKLLVGNPNKNYVNNQLRLPSSNFGLPYEFYYVSRNNSDILTYLVTVHPIHTSKKYKKNTIAFFSDCHELVKKLKNKEFERSEIDEVVKFYNKKCSQ